ncbi:MAG: methyltransferase domain-containing protein [Hyphomicrobiaceae bacterium]
MSDEPTTADRLGALLDHLGLARAVFATQMPGDLAEFASRSPEQIAGVILTVPARLEPSPFQAVAARSLIVSGDSGVSLEPARRAIAALGQARLHLLEDYETTGWADVAKERGDELARALLAHVADAAAHGMAASTLPAGAPRTGTHAGISYRIDGAGPALVLMPFFLAASQWDPIVDRLARHVSVMRLGGAHLGGVAALEDRALAPTYRGMFQNLVAFLDPDEGDAVLDVGCGSGALDRLLVRVRPDLAVTGLDLNAYLLREAAELAECEGLADCITFAQGSAEAIPFPDASFDHAFSITVLEECDADRAIREMIRVVRPGGRVGIVVRSIDIQQWWSPALPPELAARANVPPQSVGRGGVADGSLYRRMSDAGLVDLMPFPSLITLDQPGGSIWRYREDHLVGQLDPEDRAIWRQARAEALAAGRLFQAHAMHCAVGRKPAA